jgi:PPOX class probable F420-dependent enzyme
MSRRDEIRMADGEVAAFLEAQQTAYVATMGPHGRPHLVPVFYVMRHESLVTWSYAKAQKVANLRRLPQATVLVESGKSYDELRAVSMECDVDILSDTEQVAAIGWALTQRMVANDEVATAASQFVRAQAPKRVGLVFRPTRVISWDHAKLGGNY